MAQLDWNPYGQVTSYDDPNTGKTSYSVTENPNTTVGYNPPPASSPYTFGFDPSKLRLLSSASQEVAPGIITNYPSQVRPTPGTPLYTIDPRVLAGGSNPTVPNALRQYMANYNSSGSSPYGQGSYALDVRGMIPGITSASYGHDASVSVPLSQATGPGQYGTPGSGTGTGTAPVSSVDQWLANLGPDLGYLREFIENGGNPIDKTEAWQSMVDAMDRNNKFRAADLAEYFNVSGNRFSTAFGDSMTDFWTQVAKDQNSTLGLLQTNAQEAAMQRMLSAAGSLGGYAYGGASQLSNQAFQSSLQQMMQQYGAAQSMYQGGLNSQLQTAMALAGYGAQGAMALQNGSILGAQGLFGTENQAAMAEYQRQLALQQLGIGTAQGLSNLWQSNLGLGANLGMQGYGIDQASLNALYQEYLRTQPTANPLLPYMFGGSTSYPNLAYPQFRQSQLPAYLGAAGSIAGAIPGIVNTATSIWDRINKYAGYNVYDPLGSWGGSGWGYNDPFGYNFSWY